LFVIPNIAYVFTLYDANGNQLWSAPYVDGALITTLPNTAIPIAATAAEIAAGVTIVNSYLAPGIVDRYGTNTTPGTTPMSAAVQAACNQMMKPGGSPVVYLPGVYLQDQGTPTFGTQGGGTILPIDISGAANYGTQIINGAAAGASACFDFTGYSGASLRNLVISCSSVNKNDGVRVGTANSGIETICVSLRNIWCLVAGHGFVLADTNSINVIDCNSWSNGNNLLQITPVVTGTDILTHIYLTGGFCIDIRIRRFQGWPGSGYAANMNAIKADAVELINVSIDVALIQGSGGTNSLYALDFGLNGTTTSSAGNTFRNIYHENALLRFSNMNASEIVGCTAGSSGGGITLQYGCRGNFINSVYEVGTGITLTFDSTSYGNVYLGYTQVISDAATPPNLSLGSVIGGVGIGPVVGGLILQTLTYSATIAPNVQLGKFMTVSVTNNSAFAIAVPTGLTIGDQFSIQIRAVGATPGTCTFASGYKMASNTPTMPASGYYRVFPFLWNGVNAEALPSSPADIPN
jgi:hypothetical protein